MQTPPRQGLCSCSHWSQAMGPGAQGTKAPFSGVRERRGVVNRGSCCRWGLGYSHTGKNAWLADTEHVKVVVLKA